MLTCFNLKPAVSIDDFRQVLVDFTIHLEELGLVDRTGPIGRRQRHPVMDTDKERDHEYFFIMSFRDHAQCDRAVDYIRPRKGPGEVIHKALYSKIKDEIFICWEDL